MPEPETFCIGVMKASLHDEMSPEFESIVDDATQHVRNRLTDRLNLNVDVFNFRGARPASNLPDYSPLELLQLGLAERAGREIHFLLVIMEADLSTSNHTYRLTLPSKLTNIGLLSTRRLSPRFHWNEADRDTTSQRLATLMLHTLGHIFDLTHEDDPQNLMYSFHSAHDLDMMQDITPEQIEHMREIIPLEAHEEVTHQRRAWFVLRHIIGNTRIIIETVTEAKPFQLISRLSTVLTAAFSVIIVLFFTAEIWDMAGTLQLLPLVVFSLVALVSSTGVFYSVFRLRSGNRQQQLGESRVVITSATLVTLFLVNLLLYGLFFGVSVFSALLMFPDELKVTWATANPANTLTAQIKLGMFLATMGVLTGSLGGRVDSESIIHNVLFFDEET